RRYAPDGVARGEIDLPGVGSVTHVAGSPDSSVVTFGYHSFVQPPSCYVVDLADGERRDISPVALPEGYDPADILIQQVNYPSKDGTPISMFVVHHRDVLLDGDNPTYLTGYGGFNISLGSGYQAALPAWLECGGVLALPNLRGGGEYGEAWHRAGMREYKQNVFDDFIAAAEWLVEQNYTRPENLAIGGGSNGGLLMGAAITQRPDLFGAVFCAVPLLDMLRYHHFRIARLWIPEYGSAEEPDAFHWLRAYSPYHNVRAGTAYPAILITTGEQDSRVDPLHARKMTALLQAATSADGERPVLLRAEANAGHGQGKPLRKRVAEAADQWGFIGWRLGMDWTAPTGRGANGRPT
nr:S9 family peptidase [Chloroflexia bacterium]